MSDGFAAGRFLTLMPLDGSGNGEGWFSCGTTGMLSEAKSVISPTFDCESCALQWVWRITSQGNTLQQTHVCSDVEVGVPEGSACTGLCQNNGVCVNNLCHCSKEWAGPFCQQYIGGGIL